MKKTILLLLIATLCITTKTKEQDKDKKIKCCEHHEEKKSTTKTETNKKISEPAKELCTIKELDNWYNDSLLKEKEVNSKEQLYLKNREIKDLYTAKLDYMAKTKSIPRSDSVLDLVRKELQNEIRRIKLKYASKRHDIAKQEISSVHSIRKIYIQRKESIRKEDEEKVLKTLKKIEKTLEKLKIAKS